MTWTILLADRGVLLAGDMLSDVLSPLFDPRQDDQLSAYETALGRLDEAARHVDVVVPGHGAVAEGPEVAARPAAEHACIDALRRGEEPIDARLGPHAEWLNGPTGQTWSGPEGGRASDGSRVRGRSFPSRERSDTGGALPDPARRPRPVAR